MKLRVVKYKRDDDESIVEYEPEDQEQSSVFDHYEEAIEEGRLDDHFIEVIEDYREEAVEIGEQIVKEIREVLRLGFFCGPHWKQYDWSEKTRDLPKFLEDNLEFKSKVEYDFNGGKSFTRINIYQRSLPGGSVWYPVEGLMEVVTKPSVTVHQNSGPDRNKPFAPTLNLLGHRKSHYFGKDHHYHIYIHLTEQDDKFEDCDDG